MAVGWLYLTPNDILMILMFAVCEDIPLTDAMNSGSTKSGGAPSQLTATFMSSLLQSGDLQHHIVTTLQPAYARRYYSLMSAIEKYLIPLGVELPQEDRDHMGYVDFATQVPPC